MSQYESDTEHGVATQEKTDISEPCLYKVLLHNDDYTTMDFVVMILENIFHRSPAEATQIMLSVHQKGIGICGVYPYDVAQTKVATVLTLAKKYEFPLQCTLEEE